MTIKYAYMEYISRILTKPQNNFFLFGCRGTGKSTWIKNNFKGAYIISLLDEKKYQTFSAYPELFADEIRAQSSFYEWIVIDEIQRLPQLLNEVHRAIESLNIKFILCSSSARKLKRTGVNLLGGRALQRFLFPFLPQELGTKFSLEKALYTGLLPLILASETPEEQIEAYTQLYIKEEIQAEALVRNLPGFIRFLPIAALSHSQTINISNISRESHVSRPTVQGYIDILEDTLLAFRISGYEARLRVKERKLPKLYWIDPGIVNGILKQKNPPEGELRENLFEGLVAVFLRSMMLYEKDFCDDLFYWSPGEAVQTEVDFLIKRRNEFIALEVKSGKTPRKSWFKGLKAISDLKGITRKIIVYPYGEQYKTQDGIEIIPFIDFIMQASVNKLWL